MSQTKEIVQAIQTIEMQGTKKTSLIYDLLETKFPNTRREVFRRIMHDIKIGKIIP